MPQDLAKHSQAQQFLRGFQEDYLDEASSLWALRALAVLQPHYSLRDLAELDRRLQAQLNGLRLCTDSAWALCQEVLGKAGADEVFVAAVLAFEGGDEGRVQRVRRAGAADLAVSRGLISALGWLPDEQAAKHFPALFGAQSPVLRRAGIAAAAIHRRSPQAALAEALAAADPPLRARAYRAVGELGLTGLMATLRKGLTDADAGCRFAAAWSAALLAGDPAALGVLTFTAEEPGPFAVRAASLAGRRLPLPSAHAWRIKLMETLKLMEHALLVAGAIGDPVVIPWLIDHMAEPALARPAGEAFSMITGADLNQLSLSGQKPEGFDAGPTDNPEDENVAMDPHEGLPWPNPKLVAIWWEKNRGCFPKGTRHVAGRVITIEGCREVLKHGYQRQRAAAAVELARLQPGTPLFEVRAPAARQQALLAAPG
jgi:uncharacterized protein (TIGR02270 family)